MTEVILNYTPNQGIDGRPNQIDFHQGRHRTSFRLCICGQRAGKTYANLGECLVWASQYPGSVGWVGEPDFPMTKRILLPTLYKILGVHDLEASPLIDTYNKTDHCIVFTNGSVLWIGSMDNPSKNEGITLDYAGLDEGRLIRNWDPESLESCWTILKARLSGTGALPKGIFPQLWITTTPPPILSDMWKLFALESNSEHRVEDIQLFSWHQSDNSTLDEHYLNMQKATVKTKAQQDAFLFGMWPSTGTGVIPFDYNKHVILDWDQIPDKEYIRRVIYGVDWGYSPDPFVIVVILIDNNGRCYLVDEFYEVEFDPTKRWEAARDMVEKWGKGTFWCGRDRPEFIRNFKDNRIDARADESKRDDGIDDLIGMFYDWDGSPKFFIWHECRNSIFEMSQYDSEKDEMDHCVDASRYAIENHFKSGKPGMGAATRDVPRTQRRSR